MVFSTGETSEDLKSLYNPEGSTLRNAQYRMLEMLVFLRDVCRENGITWCLEGGNVLGAVRHGGFIPWDDDVDVIMERKDYMRFINYMETHSHPQYVLQTHKSDSGYYGTWVILRDTHSEYIQDTYKHNLRKFRGLQIDIFPIQRGNLKALSYVSRVSFAVFYTWLLGKNHFLNNALYYAQMKVLFPIFRGISAICGDKQCFSYEYGHGWYPKWKYNDVFPTKPLLFEGIEFPGPNNVDAYLKAIYIDYMKLPPINKRNKHTAEIRIWND